MRPSSSKDPSSPSAHCQLASMIEHTLLGDDLDEHRVIKHIKEAIELDVFGVCLPLAFVPLAKKRLRGTNKLVVTVVDFPLGQGALREKLLQSSAAKEFGADEIDLVMNYQSLLNKDYQKVFDELLAVVRQVPDIPVKVIVETSALSKEQLAISCALVAMSGAKFIKTSTGFHKGGALIEDIELMRRLLPDRVLIKASGKIRTHEQAKEMIDAGASRIGTSCSKQILEV